MAYQRAGGDKRGNCRDREARRRWMKSPEAGFGGNGETVPCVHCGIDLHHPEADRIVPGGTYARTNVQPACRGCNLGRSNNTTWAFQPAFA